MARELHRITVEAPKEMQSEITAVKNKSYAGKSQSAMIRDLIVRGLKEADKVKSEDLRKTDEFLHGQP